MLEMKTILGHIFRNFTIECKDRIEDIQITSDVITKPLNPIRISFK
ncbi:hypothetical protein B4U80_05789 [Leptotrombidium deliense]|uniref:Uncharacterized protein n=1 Tax=Leptotrombidium deliense TaxID=299467 RepID=A0A443S2K6_9ACAR|nr:hypothetical protein B4U80_05789 [Leptotrombidium deliense]